MRLNSRMGLLEDDATVTPKLRPGQFHGPGEARTGYSEANQREFLRRWADEVEVPGTSAATLDVGHVAPAAVADLTVTHAEGAVAGAATNGARA